MAKFAKAHGLSNPKAKKLLEGVLSYTLHKPRQRKFPTIPVMAFFIDQQWVMVLMDVQKLAKWNQGHRCITTVVDVLSKYTWTVPLKKQERDSHGESLARPFKTNQPSKVQSDDGTEFFNSNVKAFFKQHHVNHFSIQGDTNAANAEYMIKTLKTKLYLYFTAANTLKYLYALPKTVNQYNHNIHSSIKEKPANVIPENERLIWNRLYGKLLSKVSIPKLKVGDKVHLKKIYIYRVVEKGYLPGWKEEVFLVVKIHTVRPVGTYTLTERNGSPIKGTFYKQDVQKGWCPMMLYFVSIKY